MRHALSHQFKHPPSEWQFVEQPNSAPKVNNLPDNCFFSLSHSHGTICLAISNEPVGIDIEQKKMRQNFSSLAKAFMNPEEIELLNASDESAMDTFYKIWCAKEASYKATTVCAQRTLFLKQINYVDLVAASTEKNLSQGSIEQCHLALVTQSKPKNIKPLDANTFNGTVKIRWI